MANHIWKSPFCCKRQHQTLEMLTRQGEEDPHTTAPGSSTPPNSQPGGHDLDHSPSDHIDTFDPENHTGNQRFKVHLKEETAGFVITHDQPDFQDLECDGSYAPWISKAEWELVHWLGTSQLSHSDINKFLKLEWVSQVICL